MTSPEKIARQKRTLTILIIVLALGAITIATLATRIPLPLRLLAAAVDLVAAGVLYVAMRQEAAKK
jgi:hypothetical protein